MWYLKSLTSRLLFLVGVKIVPIHGRYLIVKEDSNAISLTVKITLFIIFAGMQTGLYAFVMLAFFPDLF